MIEFKTISAVAFKSANVTYIYDSFSNAFLKTKPIIVDLIDDYNMLKASEIINRYKTKHNPKDILDAIKEIENIQIKSKALTPFNIEKFSLSSEEDTSLKIHSKLNGFLNQLVLNVTENCNLRCEYCIYSGQYSKRRKHNKNNDMPWNIAKRAIDFFVSHSNSSKNKFISFYGGEPLMKIDLIRKIIEYVKRIDSTIWFSISTNGTLLNENIVAFFEKANVSIAISLDGPKEVNDKFRKYQNGKGTFNKVYKNLTMIKEKYPKYYSLKVDISAVNVPSECTPEEINKFFSNPEFVTSINPRRLYMGTINPENNKFYEKYCYNEHLDKFMSSMYLLYENYHLGNKQLNKIVLARSLLSRVLRRIHFRQNKRLIDYSFYWPNGLCIPGMRSLFVSCDGSFYPCEKFYDENDLFIGDVFNGFYYEKIAKLILEYCKLSIEECKKCWAYRFCGACFLSIRENSDFNLSKRKTFCYRFRKTLIRAFTFYCKILSMNKDALNYLKTEPEDVHYVKDMIF